MACTPGRPRPSHRRPRPTRSIRSDGPSARRCSGSWKSSAATSATSRASWASAGTRCIGRCSGCESGGRSRNRCTDPAPRPALAGAAAVGAPRRIAAVNDAKSEHLLLLTGKLAEKSLVRMLESLPDAPFTWHVHELGLNVAGLMTADMIERRLPDAMGADRILVPGRCRGDLEALSRRFGVPVLRGPEELADLPQFFGRQARPVDLSRYRTIIFAEIVDA